MGRSARGREATGEGPPEAPVAGALAVDRSALTPIVHALLGDGYRPARWRVDALGERFNVVSGGVFRVSGTAERGDESAPWATVLKVCRRHDSPASDDPRATAYWQREYLAYTTGLLGRLPSGGLRAPRCYAAEERDNGTAWLWLEHLEDVNRGAWPLDAYAAAARHAGRTNGAYLAGLALPTVPWLCSGICRQYVERWGRPIERLTERANEPLVRLQWPDTRTVERIVRLWRERELFLEALDRLPQTLCHLDLATFNAFTVTAPDGQYETVAVDWAFLGTAAPGEELAPLVCASPALVPEHAARAREIGETAFDAYLASLRDAGWDGDARVARLGYCAGAIRFGLMAWSLFALDNPAGAAHVSRTFAVSVEAMATGLGAVQQYTLDLADEARALMEVV